MPRTKQIEKQDILRAAAEVIRQKGESALTVRSIAGVLGCSTQPLYYEFANIEQLRAELLPYVRQQYLQFRCSNYKEFGRHFLNFARQEKELFRFVYLRRRAPGETLLDDINYDETIRLLSQNLEMEPETARRMHHQMQLRCYGLGVMLATDYLELTEAQIETELTEFYSLILRHYKGITDDAQLQYWLGRSRNLIL
ncbi:MAG TPA: TetR/AcrR family transcriptional regulator [Candidatus Gemmiger excrementigallinarum]|uniref:TetR/AcrR family transcriptional regulator n=1 Tax=Candidatus Gemmiger excrementigallinarum TaxID=2838609 RepID=A0A9D2ETQ1_9FIRM|nr:helix-turn-helix domain-containing protein [uncultured Subdoligranulum sp.]HIZ43046.1 TetR/AcrR family transcriptional regulator [Candidatus Gemmiger excrementigallinarum]